MSKKYFEILELFDVKIDTSEIEVVKEIFPLSDTRLVMFNDTGGSFVLEETDFFNYDDDKRFIQDSFGVEKVDWVLPGDTEIESYYDARKEGYMDVDRAWVRFGDTYYALAQVS